MPEHVRPLWDTRALVRGALAVRAAALRALDADGELLRRSRELIARSVALCSAAVPAVASAAVDTRRVAVELHCAHAGCTRAAVFRPCFAFECGERWITVDDLPLRVCAEHRAYLVTLFRQQGTLELLRRRLEGSARPSSVRVLFELVAAQR